MMRFFRSVPRDLEEQAMIDGYSRLAVIQKVVLPLAVPGMLTVVIFAFTLVLQEFVYALTFISQTIPRFARRVSGRQGLLRRPGVCHGRVNPYV